MNKRIISCMLSFSVFFTYCNVFSQGSEVLNSISKDEVVSFIVEMDSDGVLELEETNGFDSERAELASVVRSSQEEAVFMAEKLLNKKVQMRYTHVINGFAIDGPLDMMEKLKAIDGVKNVYVSEERFEFMSGEAQTVQYLPKNQDIAVGLDKVCNDYSGKGIVIGIIDSELDTTHPAFNTPPQNPKLSKEDISNILSTHDLNAETLNKNTNADNVYLNEKIPFVFDYLGKDFEPSYENNYHGTHVTGVAAGKSDDFLGAASDAQVVFMKCARDSKDAGLSDSYVISALDDLVKIGVDVINMSFGYDAGFTLDLFDEVISNVSKSGIVIAASAGNRGRMTYSAAVMEEAPLTKYPDYGLVACPSTNEASVSVAAAAVHAGFRKFEFNGENVFYEDSSLKYMSKDFYTTFAGQDLEFEYIGIANGEEGYKDINLTGKIALADRGAVSFEEKVAYAAQKGAVGVIVANTDESFLTMAIANQTIPSIVIRKTDGDKLKQSATKIITVSDDERYAAGIPAVSMASFSGWGVTPDLKLKPDITAIGQNVYSAAYGSSYEYMHGTSMSSPQYAGCAAVVLEYLNGINSQLDKIQKQNLAKLLLCSSAVVATKDSIPVTPRNQGSGVIDVSRAVKTPVVLHNNGQTKVNLGDKLENTFEFTITAQNITSEKVTYNLDGVVLTDNYTTDSKGNNLVTDTRLFNNDEAKIIFDTPHITIGANESKDIRVKIELDESVVNNNFKVFENGFYIDGFIRLTNDEYPEISIPFMGFKGDWLSAPIFHGTKTNPGNDTSIASNKKMYSDETGLMGYTNNQYRRLNCDMNEARYYYSPKVFGQLRYISANIRNIRESRIGVYDSNNVIKNIWILSNIRKTPFDFYRFPVYTLPVNTYKDGEYIMKISSVLDYGNTPDNTQEMEFKLYVDSQPPSAEGVYIKDGNLYIKISDNSGNAGAALKNASGSMIYGKRVEENDGLYSFNLFGIDLNEYELYVFDPAQNGAKIKISSGFEGVFEKNKLCEVNEVKIFSFGEEIINLPTTEKTNVTVKYFAWDNNMVPLFSVKQYSINN